ncbi:MAG: metal ABC transporter permease [Gemmataceae bacterium]
MSPQAEVLLIAILAAAACALPGCFLVLRRMALVGDAISHVLLLGIVVAFMLVRSLASPWLVVGATLSGVLAVALVEALGRTRLVKEDAALGLVFPALFSVAVILVSRHAGNVHLDVDAVLLGELAYAPERRTDILGFDVPQSLPVLLAVCGLNLAFIVGFYKELKLATFDAPLAAAFGFLPALLHYGLVTLVSLTCVAAFDAVGSVLVVALLIVPAATAYLLTDRLGVMLALSVLVGALGAACGFALGELFDVNYAGAMATALGVLFALTLALSPRRGLVAQWRRHRRQTREFAMAMLLVHLGTHEGTPEMADECRRDGLHEHLSWPREKVERALRDSERAGLTISRDGLEVLTNAGRAVARETQADHGPG